MNWISYVKSTERSKMVDPNDLSDVVSRAVSAIQQRPQTSRQARNNDNDNISRLEPDVQQIQDDHNWRNILSFWILGLCNSKFEWDENTKNRGFYNLFIRITDYGFVVMLSAAYDIIKRFDSISVRHKFLSSNSFSISALTILLIEAWIFHGSVCSSNRSWLQYHINGCVAIGWYTTIVTGQTDCSISAYVYQVSSIEFEMWKNKILNQTYFLFSVP